MNYLTSPKSLIIIILLSVVSYTSKAQTEVEIFQEAFGLEKKMLVADFMNLGEEAATFWRIYEQYEAERKNLGKERIDIIVDYADRYANISDDEILVLFSRREKLNKAYDKMQKKYFKQMSKEIGVAKAAQFWQLESYINSIITANIYSQIPFIGENLEGN